MSSVRNTRHPPGTQLTPTRYAPSGDHCRLVTLSIVTAELEEFARSSTTIRPGRPGTTGSHRSSREIARAVQREAGSVGTHVEGDGVRHDLRRPASTSSRTTSPHARTPLFNERYQISR